MPVRSTMSSLITLVRTMIFDPSGGSQQFADQDVQDRLDANRNDVRYEQLQIAPSIVNLASTNNQPETIFADYYSQYGWWETDCVLQGQGVGGAAWAVLTPTTSDYIVGHFQFENTPFVNGTVPGQLPPVFITGKIYDIYAASADLLEFWAASLASAYDITVDGQTLRRSQLMAAKLTLAKSYRCMAKPKVARMSRHDVMAPISSTQIRLLDSGDALKGA